MLVSGEGKGGGMTESQISWRMTSSKERQLNKWVYDTMSDGGECYEETQSVVGKKEGMLV